MLIVVLLTALIGGSGLLLFGAQSELGRIELDIAALDPANDDSARLGQVSQIATNGWMAATLNLSYMRTLLDTMTKGKCCTFESDFAVPSLNWLSQAATALSDEKGRVASIEMSSTAGKAAHAQVIKLYESHEAAVQRMTDLIVNWNSFFDANRDRRLQETGEALQAEMLAYTGTTKQLSQSVAEAGQAQADAAPRRQVLQESIPGWQLRANVAMGGIAAGLLLFAGFIVFLFRSRTAATKPALQSVPSTSSAKTTSRKIKQKQHR